MDELDVLADGTGALPRELGQNPVGLQPGGRRFLAAGGKVTAPGPVFEARDHAGAQRVEHDVARQFEQVAVALDENGLVAPLENMPHPRIGAVEALGVDAVELPHALREVGLIRLDQNGSGSSSGTTRDTPS